MYFVCLVPVLLACLFDSVLLSVLCLCLSCVWCVAVCVSVEVCVWMYICQAWRFCLCFGCVGISHCLCLDLYGSGLSGYLSAWCLEVRFGLLCLLMLVCLVVAEWCTSVSS